MTRHGVVVSLAGGASRAVVELDGAGCGACRSGRGCGIVLLPEAGSRVQIPCQNKVGARPGERVTVAMAEPGTDWLWMVLAAYGLPTLGLLTGSLLGLAGVALGLAGGLFVGSRVSRGLARRAEASLQPYDARIVSLYQAGRA